MDSLKTKNSENKITDKQAIIENYINVLAGLSKSMDDFMFLYDIESNKNYIYGNVEEKYNLNKAADGTYTVADMLEIVHPLDRDMVAGGIENIIKGKASSRNSEYRWIDKNGKPVWVKVRASITKDEDGNPFVMVGSVSEEAMKHLYNPLTGLYNKYRLKEDLKNKYLVKGNCYFVLIDIDGLALINLSNGRAYGDFVLKTLAEVLEKHSKTINVYHVDHTCFAVFVDAKNESEIYDFYNEIQNSILEYCTITAGVIPVNNKIFPDESQFYDLAKLTLKKAKKSDSTSIEFFNEKDIENVISSVELADELYKSVNNNFSGFYLNYQPQVKSGSYSLYSLEALLRYESPVRGKVFPDEFIPVLEHIGLIDKVGLWVLEVALLQCKEWRKYIPDLRVSVNFSALQFNDVVLAEKVHHVLEKTEMPGECLTIEITESVSLQGNEQFYQILKHLKHMGIQIAIDDFGTGYSNLGYLKRLEVDEIKIDRMFISGIQEDTYNYQLIRNTLEFAKANSIRICCEGVEDKKELAVLERLSPDVFQGYLFDKPCEVEQIKSFYLESYTEEFKKRIEFIKMLYDFKEKMSVIRFEPKDILQRTNVGLWIVRTNTETGYCEMHADETMENIMGMNSIYSPEECYKFWHSRIKEDCVDYVEKSLKVMSEHDKPVQLQYSWMHPVLGEVVVRSTGIRGKDTDGMIVIEGYHRIWDNIDEV